MKREILFKAKRSDTGEWIEGFYGVKGGCTDIETHVIMVSTLQSNVTIPFFYFEDINVDPETVCQFTGQTDKNGVKVFEGDIVKFIDFATIPESPSECITDVFYWTEMS